MTKIRLKYIHVFKDRHGHTRHYFRRKGRRVALPGLPGSAEFMDAYQAALAGDEKPAPKSAPPPGSISAVIAAFYQSADFKQLRDSTKSTYRGILERFRADHGEKPVKRLEPRHVRKIIAAKTETPAAANNLLRILRLVMRFAMEDGQITADPTNGVRKIKHKTEGFATWSEQDIEKFEAAFPVGTRERLALTLLLYTGARRSDVVKLGRQHIRAGKLVFNQQKTDGRVAIPIHQTLAAALATVPETQLTFLMTGFGKPFTPVGFYNWFKRSCRTAGVADNLSPHGLRKAIARRLAEAGCTPHQIGAITGHTTLKEVERYSASAARDGLADAGMAAMEGKK
jgi:integrase